jgi:hypothetical protein
MGKQIVPVLLAFVLGFGLGYMYHSQSTISSSPSRNSSATQTNTTMEASAIKFKKVGLTIARGHARKYKKKHPHDEDPKFHTLYAVWVDIKEVETYFDGTIKLAELPAQPVGTTGIRVYEAYNGGGDAVNYLVFTGESKTADGIYNDRLDAVYLIDDKKINLARYKKLRSKKSKENIVHSHIVCNPNCPEESLL